MTAEELIKLFNTEFTKDGIEKPWPNSYEVDSETYANCCQFVFDKLQRSNPYSFGFVISVSISHHKGLMFKGVELILKR